MIRKLAGNLARMILVGAVMVRAPAFFDWLYRRDWYGDMLRGWAFDTVADSDARILELGCGPGGLTRDLARRGWQVTGVDRSAAMIARAQAVGGADFIVGDALELPFGAGAFDVVLSASLVNLVQDRVALFAAMARVTRPGGVVSVLFPTPGFDRDTAQAQANDLSVTGGAALMLWSGKAPQRDPALVMQDAQAAGLIRVVCAETSVAGVVAVTGQVP